MSVKKILSPAASIIKLLIITILLVSNSKADENNIKHYSGDEGILSNITSVARNGKQDFIGISNGTDGHLPGFVTIPEFKIKFCIEPGAGIGYIGNGIIVAPVQYPSTALPASAKNLCLPGCVFVIALACATLNKVVINPKFPTITDSLPINCPPLRIHESYSVASLIAY